MVDQISLNSIRARISGLLKAMERVMQSDAGDIGKWAGAPSFAHSYDELARQYSALSGDTTLRVYNTGKIPSFGEMTWVAQKNLFDTVYADVAMMTSALEVTSPKSREPLYNLFVSGLDKAWDGDPCTLELSRCVREYTSSDLTARYGGFDEDSVNELKKLPCIFAFESGVGKDPRFGFISRILKQQNEMRIEYQISDLDHFLSAAQLKDMSFELDIGKHELFRTHWALKEVNLAKELHAKGIMLPSSVQDIKNAVDISKHNFDIALSFPGEARQFVEQIVLELESRLGPNSYFYDNNYVSQLARPSLDTLLEDIYRRAKLDVVFLGADYQKKDWCGVEFRVVKEIIMKRDHKRLMYIRTDDGHVDGVLETDGYIDARKFGPSKIADFICERLAILQ